MTTNYLHGPEVIEIPGGIVPIRLPRSGVIGLIGTAPDAEPAVAAAYTFGSAINNASLKLTAKSAGVNGNNITITLLNPRANSAALAVSVFSLDITVRLATDATGAITSTASQVLAAINAHAEASELVTASLGGGTGAGVMATLPRRYLFGGLDEALPLDTPVLVLGNRTQAARFGSTGTIPQAIDAIFDQGGAAVVVVRVAEAGDFTSQKVKLIGGVEGGTGRYLGVQAFLSSESITKVRPGILIAPGFTHDVALVQEMIPIADRLRARIYADGPNTTEAAAISFRENFGSKRVFVIDPLVKVFDPTIAADVLQPSSARFAGVRARIDSQRGFWHSISNKEIYGIIGTARVIDYVHGDSNSRANLLNENEVATVINLDGWRTWGGRTCSSDPRFAFENVVAIGDMIADALLRSQVFRTDETITSNFFTEVIADVSAFLRYLVAVGAISGGEITINRELTTAASIADGHVYFDVEYTPTYTAERITFRLRQTDRFIEEVLN